MEEKKADNKILESKAKIKEIDSKIDEEKVKDKQLDDIEEVVTSLNKNIARCLELLGKSVQGNNFEKKLIAYESENRINYRKNMGNVEAQREILKDNINKLYNEKDELLETIKEEEDK